MQIRVASLIFLVSCIGLVTSRPSPADAGHLLERTPGVRRPQRCSADYFTYHFYVSLDRDQLGLMLAQYVILETWI